MDSSLITFLRLAIAPFSNQEGERMRDHPVRHELTNSKLYMIVQRKEVFFDNFACPPKEGVLTFDLRSGDDVVKNVTLDVAQFARDEEETFTAHVKIYPNVMEIRDAEGQLRYAGTPMSAMFDYWHGRVAFDGLARFRMFTEFNLLYVGISKAEDSFTRLFERGHKKRLEILSNESQLVREARLTDELYMLLFFPEDLGIRTLGTDDDDAAIDAMHAPTPEKIRQVADAEKAFIRMLNTKYNEVRYPNFPKGIDGLYGEGLSRYVFSIDEEITLIAGPNRLRSVALKNMNPSYQGDFIFVQGDTVEIIKPLP